MKHIKKCSEFLRESTVTNLTNDLLDKINRNGLHSLTSDERRYLENPDNKDLEKWLLNDSEDTYFPSYSEYEGKIKYDEFEINEDVLFNREKLIRVINKLVSKNTTKSNIKSYSADWYGRVWFLKQVSPNVGIYLHLGDDELDIVQRTIIDDEVEDEILKVITTGRDLYHGLQKYID
jgi:hypothetical protein